MNPSTFLTVILLLAWGFVGTSRPLPASSAAAPPILAPASIVHAQGEEEEEEEPAPEEAATPFTFNVTPWTVLVVVLLINGALLLHVYSAFRKRERARASAQARSESSAAK